MNYLDFRKSIDNIPVIDTHEHLNKESGYFNTALDFFDMLIPYSCDNLLSAGLSRFDWYKLIDKSLSIEARFEIFKPYIEDIRYTTYFRAIFFSLQSDFDMKDITLEEVKKVSEKLQISNKVGVMEKMKKDLNIETIMSFIPFNQLDYFSDSGHTLVPTISDIFLRHRFDIERVGEAAGIYIDSFDALLKAIEIIFENYNKFGIKAVKFCSGYRRKLDFDLVTRDSAEKEFGAVFSEILGGDSVMCGAPFSVYPTSQLKALDDYLTDFMVSLAGKYAMPVFMHAGIHAWNGNDIESIKVACLSGLIRRHANVNFILLHCGMPFIDEAVILCKYFPNVYLNFTWCHIIDTAMSRLLVKKCIEMLPINKIHAFGGDYLYPQQVKGHLEFVKNNVAIALWELVNEGVMTSEQAQKIAYSWFYENPKELLGS